MVRQVHLEHLAAPLEHLASLGHQENLETQDRQERRVLSDPLVRPVLMEFQERQAKTVVLESLDRQDRKARKELQDHEDLTVKMDPLVRQGHPVVFSPEKMTRFRQLQVV